MAELQSWFHQGAAFGFTIFGFVLLICCCATFVMELVYSVMLCVIVLHSSSAENCVQSACFKFHLGMLLYGVFGLSNVMVIG